MKVLLFACDEAYAEELLSGLLSLEGVGLEVIDKVKHLGRDFMRLGDAVWPGYDVLVLAFFSSWGEPESKAISSLKRSIEAKAAEGSLPLRVFCWDAEEMT